MQHTTYAAIFHGIDIALSRVDHSTAVAEVSLSRIAPIKGSGNRMPKIDINLLHDEDHLSTFVQELANIPKPGWEVDIDIHLDVVKGFVRGAMGRNFAAKGLVIKRGWISTGARELMQERARRYKAIATVRRKARRNTVYMVFRVWEGQVDMDTIIGDFTRTRAQLHTMVAMHFHYIQETCPMLRWRLKQDKAAALDEQMRVACTAAANNDIKKLYTILKQLRSYTPEPPKGIQLKSGDMAKSHDQTRPRWREHFRDLLKGKDTDFQSMAARRPGMAQEDIMPTSSIDTSTIMSRGALSPMFRAIQAGKAAGPDCIPGDIGKYAPEAFAGIFHPIFSKALVRKQEPLAWRGGRMATILEEKGRRPKICSYSRGVFVADAIGQAFHKHIRTLLVSYVGKNAAYSQCGGLKHRGTDIAVLTARVFLDKRKAQNRSAAALFADVIAAFDSAIRQQLLPIDDKHEGHLGELLNAFAEDGKHAIMNITLGSCAAKEAGVPEHLPELAADVHTAAWFSIRGTGGVTETILGTKPGDPLGDLLYNLLMLRVLRALH